VILLSSWPHVIGTGNTDPRDEVAFDQIATASENVGRNAEKPEQKREFRDQLITSMIDTTVHYENSNGFVPMLMSSSPLPPTTSEEEKQPVYGTWNNSLYERGNSSKTDDNDRQTNQQHETVNLENDPAYSTEARIFLNFPNLNVNRRSFEYQGNQNEFDLLKVTNGTPVIATYSNLYEEEPSVSENGDKNLRSSPKRKAHGKGQRMENYVGNQGIVVSENNAGSPYSYYYSHNSAKDKEKKSSDQEKVVSNYQQQDALSYGSHGQSASGQNGPTASSFSRLNDEVSVFLKTKNQGVASSSHQVANNHRFSRPVVVAEPSYKFDQSSRVSDFDADDYQTSRVIDSASSEMSHRYTMNERDGKFRSDENSRDVSEDDYADEYTEKPRRVQKNRRRPNNSSKRLPKEHRGNLDDSVEHERHHSSRTKSHRQRVRGNSWTEDDRHQDRDNSYEDATRLSGSEIRHVKSQRSKFKPSNSWSQISPNLEISHSSGVEIGQLEKPKLIVPVKVNLVPVTNFDHATAIGNSQGFDVSNAILRNIVSATPLTTSTPEISTIENAIGSNGKIVSTPLPDIIVGQNNLHNSMHAILPSANEQTRFSTNFKPQYVSSTVAPVFAVTPSLSSNLQSVSVQDAQSTATSRPAIVTASNQMSSNHVPQLILPQPTFQTISTLVQAPVISPDYIQVNPHGMHGQNPIGHGNLQVQPLPTMSTPTPQTIPVTKINLITNESQNKKTLLPGSSTNFLASASLAVGHDDQRQTSNGNSYYLQNSNAADDIKPQVQGGLYQQTLKNVNVAPKTRTYLQTTHLLPAVFNSVPTFTTLSANAPQMFSEQQNVQETNLVLQQPREPGQQYARQNTGFDGSASTLKSVKLPSLVYQMIDSTASHSAANINTVNASPGVSGIIGNAHLPHIGTRNVEIVNPNIKPSPIDTTIVNSYESMHYPAAVLTTSIPMFATTSFVTTKPAVLSPTVGPTNIQNVLNTMTMDNQASTNDLKAYQSQDRPVFNPINFVPNIDVIRNQSALNSKLHATEPLQQSLNLVPLLPGGNFFKPSFSAQSELLVKPKLNSDLETYAEQMFKESLKTIYNSQKWNNDRKPGNNRHNVTDLSDIAKLKNELQRLKASLYDSKRNKDQLDAHQSETNIRTSELPSKKPDELIAALEQMLKKNKNPSDSLYTFHGNNKPHRYSRPVDQEKYNFGSNGDFRDTKHVKDFLTPPHLNSHRTKNHFHNKPGKKRPGPTRFNNHKHEHHHRPRSHPRNNLASHKSGGLEASGSNIDPVHTDGFSKYENTQDSRHFRKGPPFDLHASASALSYERSNFPQSTRHYKALDDKENAYNHPKMHNFLGLLMKNKQLPNRETQYFHDKNQLKKFFEDETQRTQQQFYDDTLRDYFYKASNDMPHSNLEQTDSNGWRTSEKKAISVFFIVLVTSTMSFAIGAEYQLLTPNFIKLKREIVETDHDVSQDHKSHRNQSIEPNIRNAEPMNPKSSSNHKNTKTVKESPFIGRSSPLMYNDVFKQSSPYVTSLLSIPSFEFQNNKRLLPYSDHLFTMSAGYKVAGDDFTRPLKQVGTDRQPKFHQNAAIDANLQMPVYKTVYPLPKASGSQIYAAMFQNEKASLPILQVRKSEELPSYVSSLQSQPLVLNPVDHQFNFAVRAPKVNSVQPSAPFLSPLSSFQGQVVPISTAANNAQFPQYKGATVEPVYPTVSGFSTMAYQPIQAQLHFGHDNVQPVQPVDNLRHSMPTEEIRSDVEIIDKHKPPPPPKTDDDEDDTPSVQGNFKPSTSFPFKQYDEKFGKYSSRYRNEDTEKPLSKYHDYSSSSDDDSDEEAPTGKYNSDGTSSKSLYDKQEDEDDDYRHVYEREKTEETSDDANMPKYKEFEAKYRAKSPKQKYIHLKEAPEVEYGSRLSKGNDPNNYEDFSDQASQRNFRYFKNFQNFNDAGGHSSDIVTSFLPTTTHNGEFEYK
ncbi:unnamed protein product, partial [Heterotrigona itama]